MAAGDAERARTMAALERARVADEARRNGGDERPDAGIFEIDVPAQQVTFFAREHALRAIEALKLVGVHGRLRDRTKEAV